VDQAALFAREPPSGFGARSALMLYLQIVHHVRLVADGRDGTDTLDRPHD